MEEYCADAASGQHGYVAHFFITRENAGTLEFPTKA